MTHESDELKIKLVELVKDHSYLLERFQELRIQLREHEKNSILEFKDIQENIADLYQQIEHLRMNSDVDHKEINQILQQTKEKFKEIEYNCDCISGGLQESTWKKLFKEISDSKVIPILKYVIFIILAILAANGLLPEGLSLR